MNTPLTASKEINFEAVAREVKKGYISWRKHPTVDLWILNYTAKCQHDWHWNDETMNCRGLIVDAQNNIISRPFQKFFTYEQLKRNIPAEPFEVYEKVDGSLGIMYFLEGKPRIATRGSFESEMAKKANELLDKKYFGGARDNQWDETTTWLFEIVYPANRIVVDYGDTEELVLLAAIETSTGEEIDLKEIDLPMRSAKRFEHMESFGPEELGLMPNDEDEGFVLRFKSGVRVKVKLKEYERLHRLLTGMTARRLYEYVGIIGMRGNYSPKQMGKALKMNPRAVEEIAAVDDPLGDVLRRVPKDFEAWVTQKALDVRAKYDAIEDQAERRFVDLGSRKANAECYKASGVNPSILFRMLDGRDYADIIWSMVRPEHERPFKEDEG